MNISVIFLTLLVATIAQTYAQQISSYQIVTKVEDIQAQPNIVLETRARCPKPKKVIGGGCFVDLFDSNLELIQAGPTPDGTAYRCFYINTNPFTSGITFRTKAICAKVGK